MESEGRHDKAIDYKGHKKEGRKISRRRKNYIVRAQATSVGIDAGSRVFLCRDGPSMEEDQTRKHSLRLGMPGDESREPWREGSARRGGGGSVLQPS